MRGEQLVQTKNFAEKTMTNSDRFDNKTQSMCIVEQKKEL